MFGPIGRTMETPVKRWHCHAKINLYLRVLGPLPSGFHELETLFQEIDFADEIHWISGKMPLEFRVTGPVACPLKGNLVLKAVDAFSDATGLQVGGEMTLEKHVPVGAGLGGGSSDAARVLMGLNQSFGFPLAPDTLVGLMISLGSDVAFFNRGGMQIGRGRGDRLEPTHVHGMPRSGFLLLPPCSISTAEVYARVKREKPWEGPVRPEVRIGENDLLSSALACSPRLQRIFSAIAPLFRDQLFFLTGSGSTLVWLPQQPSPIQGRLAEALVSHGIVWREFRFVGPSKPWK